MYKAQNIGDVSVSSERVCRMIENARKLHLLCIDFLVGGPMLSVLGFSMDALFRIPMLEAYIQWKKEKKQHRNRYVLRIFTYVLSVFIVLDFSVFCQNYCAHWPNECVHYSIRLYYRQVNLFRFLSHK